MTDQPNILIFFTDDQRFDTVQALGNTRIQTPHIDALVARGTAFTRAHIPGGTCGAVCMPSRAMLHTGRTLFHIDGEGQGIPSAHTTLGECFANAGYHTFGTGKWHNGRASFARSFAAADEIFFGGMDDHWNVPTYHFDPTGRYANRCPYVKAPFNSNAVSYRDCDHIPAGRHSTDLFVDAGLEFLRSRDRSRPFFMVMSFMAPHDPRTMPETFRNLYDPATIELPANVAATHQIDTGALTVRDELLAALPRNPEEIRRHIAEYYAMITHLDSGLGRIADGLRECGELDNTIILFAGDNGLAVGQHGLMGKQNLYDHSVRVPLILAGPGIPRNQRRDALVYLLDIFPTLCDLAHVPLPASVEGLSMSRCLEMPHAKPRETLYLAYADSIRGVTDGQHKLIEYACGATQLFDLRNDPLEMRNLATAPGSPSVLARLRQRLATMAREWDDEMHPKGETFWRQRPDLRANG